MKGGNLVWPLKYNVPALFIVFFLCLTHLSHPVDNFIRWIVSLRNDLECVVFLKHEWIGSDYKLDFTWVQFKPRSLGNRKLGWNWYLFWPYCRNYANSSLLSIFLSNTYRYAEEAVKLKGEQKRALGLYTVWRQGHWYCLHKFTSTLLLK